MLPDTLRRMEADGVERALAFVTSTFGSYNGCRKYREDLYQAVEGLRRPPVIDRLRYGYNHPGFIAACHRTGRGGPCRHSGGATGRCGDPLHRPQPPGVRGPPRPLRRPARGSRRAGGGRTRPPPPGPPPARLPEPERALRPRRMARPGRPRSAGGGEGEGVRRTWWSRPSASSATTWRWSSTSTSRRRSGRTSSGSTWSGPPPSAPTPRSST